MGGIFVGSAKPLSGLGFRCTLHEKSERERDAIAGQRKKRKQCSFGTREENFCPLLRNVLQEVSVFRHNHAIPSLPVGFCNFVRISNLFHHLCDPLSHSFFSLPSLYNPILCLSLTYLNVPTDNSSFSTIIALNGIVKYIKYINSSCLIF